MTVGGLGAVLFDMDGTLVDTEKVWRRGLADLAASYGAALDAATLDRMLGVTTPEAMEILHAGIRQPWRDRATAARRLEDYVMAAFAGGVAWRPGARELLYAVRAEGLPVALVTATDRRITEVILDTVGRDNFATIVTHDDVRHGKPHPEPYLRAAAALGVPTRRCVAVEDSPTGTASALAAGCAVLGVPGEAELPSRAGVTLVPTLAGVDVAFLRALVPAGPVAGPAPAGPVAAGPTVPGLPADPPLSAAVEA